MSNSRSYQGMFCKEVHTQNTLKALASLFDLDRPLESFLRRL